MRKRKISLKNTSKLRFVRKRKPNGRRIFLIRIPVVELKVSSETRRPYLKTSKVLKFRTLPDIRDSETAAAFAALFLYRDNPAEEVVFMVGMDHSHRPIAVSEVAHGTASEVILKPREIFIRAALMGAAGILLFHNHVSGDPSPSEEDRLVTERIVKAGRILGIELLDHVVIGQEASYSTVPFPAEGVKTKSGK